MRGGLTLYPAIDLKGGKAVRLVRGEMARATVFSDDPAARAADFVAAGCGFLHVVDLDGAFAGRAGNAAAVEAILDRVEVPVQLGGGIRDMAGIEGWLERGVARLILGTAAVRNPDLVHEACKRFPGRIAVGVDARDDRVAVEGWAETSELRSAELSRRFEDAGVAAIVFTDIARDGTLEGVNVAATRALAEAVGIPVIASGGVRDLADIDAIADAARTCRGRIDGVIVGRALYDGGLDLSAALARLAAC